MTITNEIATHSDGTTCTLATTTGDCPDNHNYTAASEPAPGTKGLLITTDGQLTITAFADLSDYQRAVGGLIETVELEDGRHDLIVNEEGLIIRLPLNQLASMIGRRPLVGNAVLVGFDPRTGENVDVDENLVNKIRSAVGSR